MSNNAPGVSAIINNLPLGQAAPAQGSDSFFIAGYAGWGEMDRPTPVASWNEFLSKFGGLHPNSEMSRAVALFFRNGGRRAWVVRLKNSAAIKASVVIPDSFGVPTTILTATAKYPSDANFADLKVTVTAGTMANTKKLAIESAKLNLREVFDNFKVTFSATEQTALDAGNSPFSNAATVTGKSQLISLAADGTNAHAAPANLPADGIFTLTGGADSIAAIDNLSASLNLFTEDFGAGVIAAPGFLTSRAAVVAAAESTKRIALLELDAADDATAALAERAAFDSAYAAMYYPPRVQMLDLGGSGIVESYSPIGAVAGIFAKAEGEIGIHKAPANYRLTEVLGYDETLYGQINEATRETLNDHQINAVVKLPEQGIKVYGARVLKSYGRVTAIHEQRVLNAIYYRLKRSLQDFVFQPANQSLFREIRSVCAQYMRELYRAGALYSPTNVEDAAYRVVCDEANNPPEQLQQNRVSVDVYVHLTGMAEMILVQINSVPISTDLSVLAGGGNQ